MTWPAWTAVCSAAALIIASLLDPGHDLVAHYVSWLSDGPYAWLGAWGVLGLGAAAAGTGWQIRRRLGGPWGDLVATSLACSALLAVAVVVWPSRGHSEPLFYTARHVGLAVGSYTGIIVAAAALGWLRWKGQVEGAPMVGLFVAIQVVVGALLLSSAAVRLFGSHWELRGLMQMLLVVVAAVWLWMASQVRRVPQA